LLVLQQLRLLVIVVLVVQLLRLLVIVLVVQLLHYSSSLAF